MSQHDDFGAAPPPKQGMGTGLKVFLILIAVFGGLSVVCCGGFALLGWWGMKTAQEAVSEDPVKIEQISAEMAEFQTPPNFIPQMSMDLKIPFTEQHVKMVIYKGPDEPEMLMLMAMNFMGTDPEAIRKQMEDALAQQGQNKGRRVHVEQYTERELTINGQPAKFFIGQGKDEQSDRECWQVIGSFQGKAGPVAFILIADQESMTEEEITQTIESIK